MNERLASSPYVTTTPEKNNGGYITVRVRFRKTGSLQYISHLDLIRTLSKVIVRTHLPLWYTEGFNPKPKISYAAPLSVGTESLCEYMDLRLTEYVREEEIRAALNRNLTDEMQVEEVYYPLSKITDLFWLSYEIRIHTVGASEELAEDCRKVLNAERIPIVKKGKAGEHEVDIRPSIRQAEISLDGGEIVLRCILRADANAFLNPEHLIKLLREKCGILSCPVLIREWYSILRVEAYRENLDLFV